MPRAGRRRVPGLRREEVAVLAGVSTDYYAQLERGNLAGVSDSVLDAIAAPQHPPEPAPPRHPEATDTSRRAAHPRRHHHDARDRHERAPGPAVGQPARL